MLILTRKTNEVIKIIIPNSLLNKDLFKFPEDIAIDLITLGNSSSCVKLGINAPKEVLIHREEIWERILAEKKQS